MMMVNMGFVGVVSGLPKSRLERQGGVDRRRTLRMNGIESFSRREFVELAFGAAVSSTTVNAGNGTEVAVTDRVYFDVSVNGKDLGRVTFGLFGKDAPKTVQEFLKLVPGNRAGDRLEPSSPEYTNSLIYRCIPGSLVDLGRIRNLTTFVVNQEVYYDFDGSVLPAAAELEVNSLMPVSRGLLAKQRFHIGPEFSIILNANPPLDSQYTIFGKVLEGDDVLEQIEQLPVRTNRSMEQEGSFADEVFQAQKKFMTSFGQNVLRDKRALDAYDYKILRRVEVVRCGRL
uniref:Peptidyl-prolyl cis-trans isomerase n=1 Tax=Rhodosorus marinus TaxID=101924 RepID=A0A7S3EGU8_9RHOD|mmetsp:Transcript_31595/g.122341  ORF Transcript_31595/g.122341 Transcript_31595/m.122341 type:complete len:286 (+) Transcript_31595:39-896(+)